MGGFRRLIDCCYYRYADVLFRTTVMSIVKSSFLLAHNLLLWALTPLIVSRLPPCQLCCALLLTTLNRLHTCRIEWHDPDDLSCSEHISSSTYNCQTPPRLARCPQYLSDRDSFLSRTGAPTSAAAPSHMIKLQLHLRTSSPFFSSYCVHR